MLHGNQPENDSSQKRKSLNVLTHTLYRNRESSSIPTFKISHFISGCNQIGVPAQVVAATQKDDFRKPERGMWDFFVERGNEGTAPGVYTLHPDRKPPRMTLL